MRSTNDMFPDQPLARRLSLAALGCLLLAVLAGSAGCKSAPPQLPAEAVAAVAAAAARVEDVRLHPGDVVQISFPAAPKMDMTERIRIDGHLFLPLIDEIMAAGKTPAQLQADLVKAYSQHLQITEVVVVVASSSASIFVSGAVARPGRIAMERPMTLLDAIMEAGGFDPKRANVKKVTVIRQKDGRYTRTIANLKPVLKGQDIRPLVLQPFDIIFVPEKIF